MKLAALLLAALLTACGGTEEDPNCEPNASGNRVCTHSSTFTQEVRLD